MKGKNILLLFGMILILFGSILTIIGEESSFYYPLVFITVGLAVIAIAYIIKRMIKN